MYLALRTGWHCLIQCPCLHTRERTLSPGFPSPIVFSFFALKRLLRHEILPFSLGIFALCPKKQSYHIQEGWASNGRETGTVPTDVLPRGDSQGPGTNTMWKGKPGWEASPSQHSLRPSAMEFRNRTLFLIHELFLPYPHPLHTLSNSYEKFGYRAHSNAFSQSLLNQESVTSIPVFPSTHSSFPLWLTRSSLCDFDQEQLLHFSPFWIPGTLADQCLLIFFME